jgi:hypothetical protein
MVSPQGENTSHLIIDTDVSLGWVEGYGNNPRIIPENRLTSGAHPLSSACFLFI